MDRVKYLTDISYFLLAILFSSPFFLRIQATNYWAAIAIRYLKHDGGCKLRSPRTSWRFGPPQSRGPGWYSPLWTADNRMTSRRWLVPYFILFPPYATQRRRVWVCMCVSPSGLLYQGLHLFSPLNAYLSLRFFWDAFSHPFVFASWYVFCQTTVWPIFFFFAKWSRHFLRITLFNFSYFPLPLSFSSFTPIDLRPYSSAPLVFAWSISLSRPPLIVISLARTGYRYSSTQISRAALYSFVAARHHFPSFLPKVAHLPQAKLDDRAGHWFRFDPGCLNSL